MAVRDACIVAARPFSFARRKRDELKMKKPGFSRPFVQDDAGSHPKIPPD
jgi:hypothetical protein